MSATNRGRYPVSRTFPESPREPKAAKIDSTPSAKKMAPVSNSIRSASAKSGPKSEGRSRGSDELVNDHEPRALREPPAPYSIIFDSKNAMLSPEFAHLWND